MSPGSWSASWKFELMPAETPLAVQFLNLQNVHVRQPEGLLVVGTALHYGEDYPCTGRLLLFRLVQEEPTAGQSTGAWEAQTAYIRYASRTSSCCSLWAPRVPSGISLEHPWLICYGDIPGWSVRAVDPTRRIRP